MLNTSNMQNSGYNMYGGRECRAPYAMTPPSSPFSGASLRTTGMNGVPGNFGTGGAPAGVTFGTGGVYSGSGAPYSISPQTALSTDTVSLSTKKAAESSPNWKKILGWTAAAAVVGGGIVAIVMQVMKSRSPEVVEKQLKQFIKFVKSGSVEDAQKFAKENFGINVVEGFTEKDLDVLNWALEALTNASNKMKGKCRVPSAIKYVERDSIAGVVTSKGRDFGNLLINKKVFGNIDESINKYLKSNDKISPSLYDTMSRFKGFFKEESFGDLEKMVESFRQSPGAISFEDKVALFTKLNSFNNFLVSSSMDKGHFATSILGELKEVKRLSSEFYKDNSGRVVCKLYKSNSPKININALGETINPDEIFSALAEALEKNKIHSVFQFHNDTTPFNFLYHEFGHLQDIERIPTRALAKGQVEKGEKMPAALKEWLDNSEAQKVAREVSEYSASGPSEFIADVFAGLMEGNKFSDNVMALYKKLHGPSIPGIV